MKIGNLTLNGVAALAPMAGATDRPFRELCCSFGAAYCVTEMVSTPAGIFIGFLPILDMLLHLPDYQMNARTSPPMFIFLASRSVITPLEVEMTAVPRPFMTFGSSAALE